MQPFLACRAAVARTALRTPPAAAAAGAGVATTTTTSTRAHECAGRRGKSRTAVEWGSGVGGAALWATQRGRYASEADLTGDAVALFPRATRFNHSCDPNAEFYNIGPTLHVRYGAACRKSFECI